MKVTFSKLQNDFNLIKEDFEGIGCFIKVMGPMKTKGFTSHDLDIIVRMMSDKTTLENLKRVCQKWNKILLRKYGIVLDAIIQNRQKKHLYDYYHAHGFDGMYGIVEVTPEKGVITGKPEYKIKRLIRLKYEPKEDS